jgi:hypothetical protein
MIFPTKKYTTTQQRVINRLESGWRVKRTNEHSNAGSQYWWVDSDGFQYDMYGKVHYTTFWNIGHKSGVDMNQFFI